MNQEEHPPRMLVSTWTEDVQHARRQNNNGVT